MVLSTIFIRCFWYDLVEDWTFDLSLSKQTLYQINKLSKELSLFIIRMFYFYFITPFRYFYYHYYYYYYMLFYLLFYFYIYIIFLPFHWFFSYLVHQCSLFWLYWFIFSLCIVTVYFPHEIYCIAWYNLIPSYKVFSLTTTIPRAGVRSNAAPASPLAARSRATLTGF